MIRALLGALFCLIACHCTAQNTAFADSIRQQYGIPGLSYAVISADSIYEIHALGVRKVHTQWTATLNDRFRIGSNTKAITGFIAALLVNQGKLNWDTKFFDLFPEMRAATNKAYRDLTLLDLLTFRAPLIKYTYTDKVPAKGQFPGDEAAQRYGFAKWFFSQPPVAGCDICFSNLGFVAAGLMLERASGKTYLQLVTELGGSLGIDFRFGQPNFSDSLQTWGHTAGLKAEPPGDSYKLNWLLAAGNINVTLPDYIRFIQLQLKGLKGQSRILPREEFEFLHYGRPQFAVGWFWETDSAKRTFSYNIGNPGSFLTSVFIYRASGKAVIVFTNVQTDLAEEGIDLLRNRLIEVYGL